MRRPALSLLAVLALVAIGGQCRGSLAQGRPVLRTTPMTALEWTASYDACVKAMGTPVILAGRHPGVSAGIGCLPFEVTEP